MMQPLLRVSAVVSARARPPVAVATPRLRMAARWAVRHREIIWIGVILLIAGLAHGINMFHFPYYENDEGTYMSQAWSVVSEGQLAPYTYWYDHAPVGWIQIAIWTVITGGIGAFGNTIESGRVLMLVYQLGATLMLYVIARRVTGSAVAASIAALAFCLSAWGIYYHRRVLLDNISTFWMLASILLLLSPRLTLGKVWLSALALGISILSKEQSIFLIPAMAYLAYHRAHPTMRLFAVPTWIAVCWSVVSLYVLMAILKGELFPPNYTLFAHSKWLPHIVLGSPHPHTSLLQGLQYQTARGNDGGLFNGESLFWLAMRSWSRSDPLLVVGGAASAVACVLLIRWQRLFGIMGLLTLSLFAFLARGGLVIGFYLVPALPLLALCVGIAVSLLVRLAVRGVQALGARGARLAPLVGSGAGLGLAALSLAVVTADYRAPDLSFARSPMQLWTSHQADAQVQALDWVEQHISPRACVVVEDSLWTDLRAGINGKPAYPCAHWYWKVDLDPAILGPVFHDRWQTIDYLVATPQMWSDAGHHTDTLLVLNAALKHSVLIKHFDTGGWPVDIRRVVKPHMLPLLNMPPPLPGARLALPTTAVHAGQRPSLAISASPRALVHITVTFPGAQPRSFFDVTDARGRLTLILPVPAHLAMRGDRATARITVQAGSSAPLRRTLLIYGRR